VLAAGSGTGVGSGGGGGVLSVAVVGGVLSVAVVVVVVVEVSLEEDAVVSDVVPICAGTDTAADDASASRSFTLFGKGISYP